jgi:hypothetical protein
MKERIKNWIFFGYGLSPGSDFAVAEKGYMQT